MAGRIYTRRGDGGETGLIGGERVPKTRARVCALGEPLDPAIVAYLNRLSDYLFVAARAANRDAGTREVQWLPALPAADDDGGARDGRG